MKIKHSFELQGIAIFLACFLTLPLSAQTPAELTEEEELPVVDPRPKETDRASQQLIQNYLTVTGGESKHRALKNVVAEGTVKVSTLQKKFKLIETNDGKRHLTYYWRHLGRNHKVIYVHDGLETWTQVLGPKESRPRSYGGSEGLHFANLRWLLQPFTLPTKADFVFKYQGADKVGGRPTHVLKGFGKKDIPSWYYFDKEKFLVIRWGGKGQIAGVEENMDYQATSFRSVDGVLLPSKIDLIVEDSAFGKIEINKIATNQNLSEVSFFMPKKTSPTLRQRPASPN